MAIVLAIAYARLARGARPPTLRPLLGGLTLQELRERAVEEGRPLHLTLGSGRLDDTTAAESLVGLALVDALAEQMLRFDHSPVVTTADPTSALVAEGMLRRGGSRRSGRPCGRARFVAPQPIAYGAATRGMIQQEPRAITMVVGHVGEEFLLLATSPPDGGQPFAPPSVAATARLETLPLLHLAAPHPAIGEEIFALGAILGRWPAHLAGVLLQDAARIVLLLAIVVGVVLRSAGAF